MPETLDEFLSGLDSLSDGVEEVRRETVILRPFQVEAYENWVKNNYRGTIIAPTGLVRLL
jgi:superfamily II DNA or RNA helicase